MANYPSIGIDNASRLLPDGGITTDQAEDGTVRGRVAFAETIWTGDIAHVFISSTERDNLMTFYNTNKAVSFTFLYDGSNYTMRFTGHPVQQHMAGNWWTVRVGMIGTKD